MRIAAFLMGDLGLGGCVSLSAALALGTVLGACSERVALDSTAGSVGPAGSGSSGGSGGGQIAGSGGGSVTTSGSGGMAGSGAGSAFDCSVFDAGAGGEAGAGGTPDGGTLPKQAEVTVHSSLCGPPGGLTPCTRIGADFSMPPQLESEVPFWTDGFCTAAFLKLPVIGGGLKPALPHAGEITVKSASKTATLVPDPLNFNQYAWANLDGEFWSGIEPVSASAPGSTVPAFEMSVFSRYANLISPVLPVAPEVLVIPSSADFELVWSGGCDGHLEVTLEMMVDTTGPKRRRLRCDLPLTAGKGVIPAEALALVSPGSGGLSMQAVARTKTAVPGWEITLEVAAHVATPAGLATAKVKLE